MRRDWASVGEVKDRQVPLGRGFLYGLYQTRLRRRLDKNAIPKHVAMIFDGNRRWARQRGLETAAHGHSAGALKIHEFLAWCDDLGVSVVTLYLLSNDNLVNRDDEELDQLFDIIAELSEAECWQRLGAAEMGRLARARQPDPEIPRRQRYRAEPTVLFDPLRSVRRRAGPGL